MAWLVVVLVVVAMIAIGAYVMEKQRSAALRRRFGPEYDRVLGDADGDRRAAETRLRDRLRQRAAVEVRDVEPAARERYETRWRVLQTGFVDDPAGAVAEAATMVEQLADERGYAPAAADDDGALDRDELVAVDHPALVDGHRAARQVGPDAPVDDLRHAFLHHRALFQALLGEDDGAGDGARGDRGRSARRPVVTEAAVVRP
jgi:hypothetical protein